MAKDISIPRDPTAALRTRRALDRLTEVLNDLISTGELTVNSDGAWVVNPGGGNNFLAGQVFGQKSFLAQLPDASGALPVLASRVFAQRVSYGSVG